MEWNEEILQALEIRDKFEKQDSEYFNAFHQLSLRLQRQSEGAGTPSSSPSPSPSLTSTGASRHKEEEDVKNSDVYKENQFLKVRNTKLVEDLNRATLRVEDTETKLAQALKAKGALEKQLEKLNSKVGHMTLQLKEKDKSIEIINDEILSNQISVNVLREKLAKVTEENETLIKRWMAKVRSDAEKLNDANARSGVM